MSTNINISVEGQDLVERSKQQQRDARTNRLTLESITKDATTNRDTLLSGSLTEPQILASTRTSDTYTAPYLRVTRPSATRLLANAFLVVTNFSPDSDYFMSSNMYVAGASGERNLLAASLDWTYYGWPISGYTNKTYVLLPQNKTLEDFTGSPAYPYVYEILLEHYTAKTDARPWGVSIIEPVLPLTPFKPARRVQYTVTAEYTNFSSKGAIMAGYLNTPEFYLSIESEGFDATHTIQWGVTNRDLLYMYPSGYPA